VAAVFDEIDDRIAAFVCGQPIFFVATAPLDAAGSVNCSPKGNRGEFAVVGPHEVAYLDQTGSGSETIAHLRENGRIVLMFCAFEGPPRIVRFHGTGTCIRADDPTFADLAQHFDAPDGVGVRSIIDVTVTRVSDSCGYAVPLMTFEQHRPTLDQWSTRKGAEGVRSYWSTHNRHSIDGLPSLSGEDPPGAPPAAPPHGEG
jgi:catechol 2,3-dioxygenase-like lactoylglutathione lyase family enzyme